MLRLTLPNDLPGDRREQVTKQKVGLSSPGEEGPGARSLYAL